MPTTFKRQSATDLKIMSVKVGVGTRPAHAWSTNTRCIGSLATTTSAERAAWRLSTAFFLPEAGSQKPTGSDSASSDTMDDVRSMLTLTLVARPAPGDKNHFQAALGARAAGRG